MADFKIGFVLPEQYGGDQHRVCETARHDGQGLTAVAIIALAPVTGFDDIDKAAGVVYGACKECFGMIDGSMQGGQAAWHLPGPYSDADEPVPRAIQHRPDTPSPPGGEAANHG